MGWHSKIAFYHFYVFLHDPYLCIHIVHPTNNIGLEFIEFISHARDCIVDCRKHFEHLIKLLSCYRIGRCGRNWIWILNCLVECFVSWFGLDLLFLRFALFEVFGKYVWLLILNASFDRFWLVDTFILCIFVVFKIFV